MAKNRRYDDEGCCGARFLEYVMFIFNFLFYLAGLAILALGIYTWWFESSYFVLLPSRMLPIVMYTLIIVGVVVLFAGILGCVGVLRQNRCCLLLFSFCLLLIFFVEAACCLLSFISAERVQHELSEHDHLRNTINRGYEQEDSITRAVTQLQTQEFCCGAGNFTDWRATEWYKQQNTKTATEERGGVTVKVPPSCCRTQRNDPQCALRDHPSWIYPDGCIEPLATSIRDFQLILSAIVLGITAVQLFGLIVTCCLYAKLGTSDDNRQRRAQEF